ncbi:hypothetical protein VTO42DRAFT_2495 [Malbranchea cinnamomea]
METKPVEEAAHEDMSHTKEENGNLDFLEDVQPREKQLMRRIDWRLLPILGTLYAIALIDRVNISNARIAGMNEELELYIGDRYSVALLVFFIPYFFFELPSNIVLRKVGAANWLAFIALAWGTFMLGQGFVKNYQSLVAFRFLIGFFEAGFFPACVYLISCWYVRYEVQVRLASFYLVSVAVGGFSSILAYGLMQMQGLRGYLGWRWIFIIEGLITQLIGIISWFLIIDFPDKAARKGFLTENEAKFVQHRIEVDRSDSIPDPLTWQKFGKHIRDWKLWIFSLMFMSATVPAYALAYFAPTIIAGMGYSAGISQLLTAPPVIFAVITAWILAWFSDKYRVRSPSIALQAIVCIVGLMLTAYGKQTGVRYFGLFLGNAGCQGNVPSVLAYQANNIRSQSKRSVGSALQIGFGAIGGIVASTVFREQDAPRYIPGLWATTGLQIFILVAVVLTSVHFWLRNKQVDNGTIKEPIEGLEGFKYTL